MSPRTASSRPGFVARALTLVSPVLPIALPLAVYFRHRARREATAGPPYSGWDRRLHRPILFTVVVWSAFLAIAFLLFGL